MNIKKKKKKADENGKEELLTLTYNKSALVLLIGN